MTLSAEEFIRRFLLHEKRADLKRVVFHWNDCRSRPFRIKSIIQTKSCVNARVAGPRREPRMTRQTNMSGRSERIPRTGSCTTTMVRFCSNSTARRGGAAVEPVRPWEEFPVVAPEGMPVE
jgi:hypothetical protein